MGVVKNGIYQVDNGTDFDEIHLRTKASQVKIQDTNNRFTSEDVEGALNELFQYADSGKNTIANSIGSPLLASDSFGAMGSKIGTIKSDVATAITSKGIATNANETFASFVSKIGQINTGKKFASGDGYLDSAGCFNISNLTFNPRIVVVMIYTDLVYVALKKGDWFTEEITVQIPRYASGAVNWLAGCSGITNGVIFKPNGFYTERYWDYYKGSWFGWQAFE